MRWTALSVVALILAGCAGTGDTSVPDPVASKPGRPLPQVEYGCLAGASPMYGSGECVQEIGTPTGAQMVQDIAASPVDPGVFVAAVYANDPAASATLALRGDVPAVPAWESWLLVSRDSGGSWARRDLPALPLPGLEQTTGIEDMGIRAIDFGPDGRLHLVVVARRGDAGLVSESVRGDVRPPQLSPLAYAFYVGTTTLGDSWEGVRLLGPMGDSRLADVEAPSSTSWVVVWSGLGEAAHYNGTLDGGATWSAPTALDGECHRTPKLVRTLEGALLMCTGVRSGMWQWDATTGFMQRVSDVPAPDRTFTIFGSTLASDGGRNATFATGEDPPSLWFSHDAGRTWEDGGEALAGTEPAASWGEVAFNGAPRIAYDGQGRIHFAGFVNIGVPDLAPTLGSPADAAALHVVRDARAGGNATAWVLMPRMSYDDPMYMSNTLARSGIGTLAPIETIAFQENRALAVFYIAGWSGFATFDVVYST